MTEGKRKFAYDSSLPTVGKFVDAVKMWEEMCLPYIPRRFNGSLDYHAASQDWTFFVDALHRDGKISDWQNHNWGCPAILED